jgi:hypothetical protein
MKLRSSPLSLTLTLSLLGPVPSALVIQREAQAAGDEVTAKIRTIFQDALQLEPSLTITRSPPRPQVPVAR